MVDGVDLSGIKLYNLRSAIAVIPQDPVLFQGIPFKEKIGVIRLCVIWQLIRNSRNLIYKNYDII